MNKELLRIEGLKTYFDTWAGIVKAVDGVDIEVIEGETLGLVGESGSGKSVTALSIMRIVPSPGKIIEGKIIYKEENIEAYGKKFGYFKNENYAFLWGCGFRNYPFHGHCSARGLSE